MKNIFLLSALCVIVGGFPAEAIDNLRIPDLRTLGLGGGGVVETPLMNPALHAWQERGKLYANYYNRYSVSELATASGGFYYKNDILPAGIEICSFGYDQYRESLFRLSMGRLLTGRWALGIAFQYALLQSELFEENSGRISTDIGISYQPTESVLAGLSLLHVPSFKVGDKNIDNEHIGSYSVQVGIRWTVIEAVSVTGSIEHCEEASLSGSFGMEYMPFADFAIRTGIRSSPLRPSFGIGYKIAGIRADVGMVYHQVLGVSMGFGISYSF